MATQNRLQVAVGLRVSPELAEWLKRQAEENHRSVANQTAWLLEQSRRQQEDHAKA
jgi:hypothetical protein